MTDSDLQGAVLNGDFRRAVFRNANLHGAQFAWINVEACDFSKCSGAIETDNIRAARADFSGASIAGSYLAFADLRGAILRDADLSNAILGGADLEGAIWVTGEICAAGSIGHCIIQ